MEVEVIELLDVWFLNAIPLYENSDGVETIFALKFQTVAADELLDMASWACYTPICGKGTQ